MGTNMNVGVSVVTYTYNDNGLVEELLDSIDGWNLCPAEVIVVDDCSRNVFLYEKKINGRIPRIIRSESNMGPTGAKQRGISEARSRYVLSIDADARISPNWLDECLPLASAKDTGLVGTPVAYEAGDSLDAQYLRLTCSYAPGVGEVPMVPGPVFLIEKAVFDAVGGFSRHGGRIGEDAYLNRVLSRAGYRQMVTDRAWAAQVRGLSRATAMKRMFVWQMGSYLHELKRGTSLAEVSGVFIHSCARRPGMSHENKCFAYYDMLYCVYGVLCLAKKAQSFYCDVCSYFDSYFSPFPALGPLMAGDLRALGHDVSQGVDPAKVDIPAFNKLFSRELCTVLDARCAHRIAQSECAEDFSMYRDMAV